jgi:hypothetical protein
MSGRFGKQISVNVDLNITQANQVAAPAIRRVGFARSDGHSQTEVKLNFSLMTMGMLMGSSAAAE